MHVFLYFINILFYKLAFILKTVYQTILFAINLAPNCNYQSLTAASDIFMGLYNTYIISRVVRTCRFRQVCRCRFQKFLKK